MWYVRWLPIFWRTTTPQLSFMLNIKAAGACVTLAYVCQIILHDIFECHNVNTLEENPIANGYVWCITGTVMY